MVVEWELARVRDTRRRMRERRLAQGQNRHIEDRTALVDQIRNTRRRRMLGLDMGVTRT